MKLLLSTILFVFILINQAFAVEVGDTVRTSTGKIGVVKAIHGELVSVEFDGETRFVSKTKLLVINQNNVQNSVAISGSTEELIAAVKKAEAVTQEYEKGVVAFDASSSISCEENAAKRIQRVYLKSKQTKDLRMHEDTKKMFSFNKKEPKILAFYNDLKQQVSETAMDAGLTTKPIQFLSTTRPYALPRNTLTKEEESALRSYTSGGYTSMNEYLRLGREETLKEYEKEKERLVRDYGERGLKRFNEYYDIAKTEKKVESLNSALEKFPPYAGEFVYRYSFFVPEVIDSLKEGGVFTENSFLSTSKRIEYPGSFLVPGEVNRIMNSKKDFVLFIIKHKSARDVSKFSGKFYEEEALIPSGKSFRIVKGIHSGQDHLIFVEELGPQ